MSAASPNNLRQARAVPAGSDLLCLARVAGTSQLWAGGRDGKLHSVDLAADRPSPVATAAHASYVSGVVLTEKCVVSAGWDRKLMWWDRATRKLVRTVDAHQSWIRRLAVLPDGSAVASIADDLACRLWDASTGRLLRELSGHAPTIPSHYPNKLYALAVSPDGRHVATGDFLGQVLVHDLKTGERLAALDGPDFYNPRPTLLGWGGLRALAFSPDGGRLAAAGMQNTDPYITNGFPLVHVHDWKAGKRTHELKAGKDFQFESVCFGGKGEWLVAASGNGKASLAVFDLESGRAIKELTPPSQVSGLVLSEDSQTLFGAGRQFIQWELKG